jgi:diaminohydroxyphosphoribosylaminopyrimidine deaminase/5-amino-6-(5-phosphoribosylamino)uracil reductase
VQKWRAQSGAIITGIGTVLADNPSLTVRPQDWTDWRYGEVVQPKRVVLDSQLRIPLDALILQTTGVIVVTLQPITHIKVQQLQALGVDVWCFAASSSSRIDVVWVLKKLAEQGVNEVLVEAGAIIAGAFIEANVVDEWVLYFAPTLLGSDAKPMFDWPIQTMAQQQKLQISDMRMIGGDIRVLAKPR